MKIYMACLYQEKTKQSAKQYKIVCFFIEMRKTHISESLQNKNIT